MTRLLSDFGGFGIAFNFGFFGPFDFFLVVFFDPNKSII